MDYVGAGNPGDGELAYAVKGAVGIHAVGGEDGEGDVWVGLVLQTRLHEML